MRVTFSLSLRSEMSHGPARKFLRYMSILPFGTLTLSISYFCVKAVFDLSVRPRYTLKVEIENIKEIQFCSALYNPHVHVLLPFVQFLGAVAVLFLYHLHRATEAVSSASTKGMVHTLLLFAPIKGHTHIMYLEFMRVPPQTTISAWVSGAREASQGWAKAT